MSSANDSSSMLAGVGTFEPLQRPSSAPDRVAVDSSGTLPQSPQEELRIHTRSASTGDQARQKLEAERRAREKARAATAQDELISIIDVVQVPDGLDTLCKPFLVSEITGSAIALQDMDHYWELYRRPRSAATGSKYRWIHLPDNNIEWARVRIFHDKLTDLELSGHTVCPDKCPELSGWR